MIHNTRYVDFMQRKHAPINVRIKSSKYIVIKYLIILKNDRDIIFQLSYF